MGRPAGDRSVDFGLEVAAAPEPRLPLDDHGLPLRLQVGEPGFSRFYGRIRVLFDGGEVTRCVAFDCAKGTITRQRLDDAGRIYVDRATDSVATETLTGQVKVEWR